MDSTRLKPASEQDMTSMIVESQQVARREKYDDENTEERFPRCVSMSLQTILYVLQASCSFSNFVHKFQDTSEETTPRNSHVTKRYSIVVPGLEVYHAKFKTGPNTPLRRFSAASPSKPGQDLTSHLHLWPSVADNAPRMRIASRANDYTDVRRVRTSSSIPSRTTSQSVGPNIAIKRRGKWRSLGIVSNVLVKTKSGISERKTDAMILPDTPFAASNASCNLVDTINATALASYSQHNSSINARVSRTSQLINSTSQSIQWSAPQAPMVESTQCHLAVHKQVPKCTLPDPVKENEGCVFTALSSEEISESCFSTNTVSRASETLQLCSQTCPEAPRTNLYKHEDSEAASDAAGTRAGGDMCTWDNKLAGNSQSTPLSRDSGEAITRDSYVVPTPISRGGSVAVPDTRESVSLDTLCQVSAYKGKIPSLMMNYSADDISPRVSHVDARQVHTTAIFQSVVDENDPRVALCSGADDSDQKVMKSWSRERCSYSQTSLPIPVSDETGVAVADPSTSAARHRRSESSTGDVEDIGLVNFFQAALFTDTCKEDVSSVHEQHCRDVLVKRELSNTSDRCSPAWELGTSAKHAIESALPITAVTSNAAHNVMARQHSAHTDQSAAVDIATMHDGTHSPLTPPTTSQQVSTQDSKRAAMPQKETAAWPPEQVGRKLLLLAAHPALASIDPVDVLASGLDHHFLPHYESYMALAFPSTPQIDTLNLLTNCELINARKQEIKAALVQSHRLMD